jgi:hypothetical protein
VTEQTGATAGDPHRLTAEQREQLIRLRWLWEKGYDISTDGETWTARSHAEPDVVLTESSSAALWQALRDDNARRKAATGRGGYWIETASGPPYFVATPPAPRFRNSGGDIF